MSSKRKNTVAKPKNRAKSRKVEYDEEDISSEQDSEVDDAEAGLNADGEDGAVEDTLADVANIPELPAPEVILVSSSRLSTPACRAWTHPVHSRETDSVFSVFVSNENDRELTLSRCLLFNI